MRGPLLALLDERLKRYEVAPPPSKPRSFARLRACIATFSYDLVRRLEPSLAPPSAPPTEGIEPDAVLAFYDTLVIHDYARGETCVVGVGGGKRLDETGEVLIAAAVTIELPAQEERLPSATNVEEKERRGERSFTPDDSARSATSNFTSDEYLAPWVELKNTFRGGHLSGQPDATDDVPVPTASRRKKSLCGCAAITGVVRRFIRRRTDVVVSASPERFLRVETGDAGGRTDRGVAD